ncbi:MAG: PstS family phosphate ABC transporter substrate-binding protein [Candidatus Eiseniibacteriota bacterium]
MGWLRRFGVPDSRRYAPRSGRALLWIRVGIYTTAALALLLFRVVPGLRPDLPKPQLFSPVDTTLVVSGTSLAPDLVARLVEQYRREYPDVEVTARPGGTTHALEDLLNGRADVAFLGRPPTDHEARIIRERGDSVLTFPIALGGVAVLAGTPSAFESLSLEDLRRVLAGHPGPLDPERLYVPDPNRGLWTSVLSQLGLPEAVPAGLHWVESEDDVLAAVAADPSSIGLASTLALPVEIASRGARLVGVRGPSSPAAVAATARDVAAGDYPLFHYLYASSRRDSGALTSGFVTYVSSGRGQRLVSRFGYLPAREVPRLVQLSSEPIRTGAT